MSVEESSSQNWRPVALAALRGRSHGDGAHRVVLPAALGPALWDLAVLELVGGGLVFVGLITWQTRAIAHSKYPGVRALAGAVRHDPPLRLALRVDVLPDEPRGSIELHVGTSRAPMRCTSRSPSSRLWGSVTSPPALEPARLVVSAQMVLDLIILGLGLRIIVTAVQRGQDRLSPPTNADTESQ